MRKILAALIAVITIITIGFASNSKVNAVNNGVEDFVKRLYSVCLDRSADPQGLNDWSSALKNKKATGISAAYGFVFSQEFQSKNCTNEQYVTYMYNAFFGRQPDAVGLQGWVDALNQGYSRERVFCGFANSTEFQILCDSYGIVRGYHVEGSNFAQTAQVNLFVDRLYREILGRGCDPQGMADWTGVLVSHKATGADAAYGFVFSPEFKNKHLCNVHYVQVLYRAFLGREGDMNGILSWTSVLDNGEAREVVFNGFAGSSEFIGICNAYGIESGTVNATTKTYATGRCSICGRWNEETPEPKDGFYREGVFNHLYYYVNNEIQNLSGWQTINGKKYYFAKYDGDIVSSAYFDDVYDIDGYRYRFNTNGVLMTGMFKYRGLKCYSNELGQIFEGWYTIDGNKYYCSRNGFLSHGWDYIDGKYYYFNDECQYEYKYGYAYYSGHYIYVNEDGTAYCGWKQIDGKWYYFDKSHFKLYPSNGAGWTTIEGAKYYLDSDGSWIKKTGWQSINDQWYYFDDNGNMKTGWVLYKDKYYYLGSDGIMQTGVVKDKGKLYFIDETGVWVDKQGWKKLDDNWYYINENGVINTRWFKDSDNKWYFSDDDGVMQTGFVCIMVHDGTGYSGKTYYFSTSGQWIHYPEGYQDVDGYTIHFNVDGSVAGWINNGKEVVRKDIYLK
ncbi:MAG: DUF4214 domain-containing protein [Saccharofermentans sp.]|nr:DUF4214 domain-containing protein [Saccharofermentans sp.]